MRGTSVVVSREWYVVGGVDKRKWFVSVICMSQTISAAQSVLHQDFQRGEREQPCIPGSKNHKGRQIVQ